MTEKKPKKQPAAKKPEELQKEYHELKNLLQRNHAEFQNYKKRTEEDKQRFVKLSNEELIKKILPILDNFELALNNTENKEEFVKGMEMIYSQLTQTLEDEGLQKIPATGKFNPELHEALLATEDKEKEPNTITEELQKGYTLNGKVIRHSKVRITKKGDKK